MKKTADLEVSLSNPSDSLKVALTEALEDEYRARAAYHLTLDTFGDLPPFANIVKAEERHVQALLPLFSKYGIPIPEDDWMQRLEAPDSVEAACEVGVKAEIDNAAMYDRLLASTKEYADVQRVFSNLQRASQENHLQAFQQCVAGVVSSEKTPASQIRVVNQPEAKAMFWVLGLSLTVAGALMGWRYLSRRRRLQEQRAVGLRTWVKTLAGNGLLNPE